jgi:hypothetical protein
MHDTPLNVLVAVPSSGLEAIDHAIPFHDSIRVWSADPL